MKIYLKTTKISNGQFSREKSVVIRDYTGEESSGFFENKNLMSGNLEITIVEEEGELALIKLPGRTLEGPGDKGYLTVKKQDLQYVA